MRTTSPANRIASSMVLTALAVFFALVAPAMAGEVHFDPESPAGKEYGLPLDQARSEAVGGETVGGGGAEAPLFGVGVSSGGGGTGEAAPSGGAAESGGGHRQGGDGAGGNGKGGGTGGGEGRGQADAGSAGGGSGASFGFGGAAALLAGIVLLAVLAGLALRAALGASRRRHLGSA